MFFHTKRAATLCRFAAHLKSMKSFTLYFWSMHAASLLVQLVIYATNSNQMYLGSNFNNVRRTVDKGVDQTT